MLATPIVTTGRSSNGPRPIDLSKDTRQVFDLLNVSFGSIRGANRSDFASGRYSLSQSGIWAAKLNQLAGGFNPGFVWEEDGRIVGNATLLKSDLPARYLVANVAVHPDYRRRGIAKGLMEEVINYVAHLDGRRIMLQVDSDNESAVSLYLSLNFDNLGTMNQMDASPERLRFLAPSHVKQISIDELSRKDWQAAYELDRRSVNPDLTWPIPPAYDQYKIDLWRRLGNLLNGRHFEGWVSWAPIPETRQTTLVGLATISSDWGRPTWLRLRIDPKFRGQVEGALLTRAIKELRRHRRATIRISHPAEDHLTSELLQEANFRIKRSLSVLSLEMPGGI